jgi:hypothetical protein
MIRPQVTDRGDRRWASPLSDSPPSPGEQGIAVLDIGEAVVITITGELEMVNAPALSTQLRDQLDRRPRGLILELDLSFCGSAGLQVVAGTATRTFDLVGFRKSSSASEQHSYAAR